MKKNKGLADVVIIIIIVLAVIISIGIWLYSKSEIAQAKHCTTQLVNATREAQLCYAELRADDQQCTYCNLYNNTLTTYNTGVCAEYGTVALIQCPLPRLPSE